MKQNIGLIDKLVRLLLALAITILLLTHQISGGLALMCIIAGAMLLLTAITGFCPAYWPFGVHTKKQENEATKA